METVILKFGGSSVADNIKLNIVAQKIISLKGEAKNVVVVVSAQGKTTDTLIKEAKELSAIPEEREMDMLLSTGEQITASKLSILLNRKGFKAISLAGWQAGIQTSNVQRNARIESICTARIEQELAKGKIVIIAGFQGINSNNDITTLGRGGSDTTAVALQAALKADKCYIFSDVDGIYSADPNMITVAKKLNEISFEEMQEIADAGAKVLHNRCVQIGKKFNCNIVAKSTFLNDGGTRVCQEIENTEVKSIVKNDALIEIKIEKEIDNIKELKEKYVSGFSENSQIEPVKVLEICKTLLNENIIIENLKINDERNITFVIKKEEQNKVQEILEERYKEYCVHQKDITKLTIVGYGITQDNVVVIKVVDMLKNANIKIKSMNLAGSKIEIFLERIENSILEELHKKLI